MIWSIFALLLAPLGALAQCQSGCGAPSLPLPMLPPPPRPCAPPPPPPQNCQPFPQQPCILPSPPPPPPNPLYPTIGSSPYFSKPAFPYPNGHYQVYPPFPPPNQYGHGYGQSTTTGMFPPYYTSQYIAANKANPIPANERFSSPFLTPADEAKSDREEMAAKQQDPFEKEAEDKGIEREKSGGGGHQRDQPPLPAGQYAGSYRIPLAIAPSSYALPSNPAVPLPSQPWSPPIIYPPINPCQQQPQPCPLTWPLPPPSPPLPQPLPIIPCPTPPLPPPPLPPMPQLPQPCALPPPSPAPHPFPAPPIQNCCLRCGRPCKTAAVKMASAKALAAKTTRLGRLAGRRKEGDDLCNDRALAKIFAEVQQLPMEEAKQTILERAEHRLTDGHIFHVFCAPKSLEYATRAELFCAGEVTDGVCFAFGTVKG